MRFTELEPGARFEWEGALYVKLGPVSAREEATGRLRMIPRYARLRPVKDNSAARPDSLPTSLPVDALRAAFDAFFAECLAALDGPPAAGRARLEAARRRFLTVLGLEPS
ncbi:hypothetical protein [Thiobacter aerophilum]|uniref:Uncharacterized protein n=1 Tax=Thiobacter aerophilum TaxID=3121275 RepID=A0ABV0EG16_9BURK